MKVESGLLFINGRDMAEMGVFLYEKSAGAHKNYDELLKGCDVKEPTAIDFAERDGEELPEEIEIRWKARDVTLQFAIVADSRGEWWQKFREFRRMLASGWLTVEVPEMDAVFRFYTKRVGEHSQFTNLGNSGRQVAGFTVVFREPKPTI